MSGRGGGSPESNGKKILEPLPACESSLMVPQLLALLAGAMGFLLGSFQCALAQRSRVRGGWGEGRRVEASETH